MSPAGGTIFAVASGAGRAAVTVLRLSGPACGTIMELVCNGRPPPRHAALRTLRDADGEVLDRALTLWFPGPASYTGEDGAELHLHGGPAVLHAVAARLTELGARPAEAGEFTRRAFLNGRMDLLEAEAVADLVAAETSAQRRQALRQLDGALGTLYTTWSGRLTGLLARQEALIDFPDEDLPHDIEAALARDIVVLRGEIMTHLDDGQRGERLRDGLVFVVAGAPNVGKSSLVNALAERDVAIVASLPGTTRDVLEARMVFGGVPVTLLDTAGLRTSEDPIETEGVRRAVARARAADLVVLVRDSGMTEADATATAAAIAGVPVLHVRSKADLIAAEPGADAVSATTGYGIEGLRARLAGEARRMAAGEGPPPLTRVRHRAALLDAAAQLARAESATMTELRGEDLRAGLRSLGSLTGHVAVENVLDAVFAQFCIGK